MAATCAAFHPSVRGAATDSGFGLPRCAGRALYSGRFPQITLYSTLLVLAYLPFCVAGSPTLRGWKTKLAHIAVSAAVIMGIGGFLGCLPLFSVAESLPYLTRERLTYESFTSDNFPPWELFTFFIPNLFGGVDRHVPIYASNTTVLWPRYTGTSACCH
jgi:hypothetical protein